MIFFYTEEIEKKNLLFCTACHLKNLKSCSGFRPCKDLVSRGITSPLPKNCYFCGLVQPLTFNAADRWLNLFSSSVPFQVIYFPIQCSSSTNELKNFHEEKPTGYPKSNTSNEQWPDQRTTLQSSIFTPQTGSISKRSDVFSARGVIVRNGKCGNLGSVLKSSWKDNKLGCALDPK